MGIEGLGRSCTQKGLPDGGGAALSATEGESVQNQNQITPNQSITDQNELQQLQPPQQPLAAAEHITPDPIQRVSISDSLNEALQRISPQEAIIRTIKEMLAVSPGVWCARLALTAGQAICASASALSFSQMVAVIGTSESLVSENVAVDAVLPVLGYFSASMGFWFGSYGLDYSNDILSERQRCRLDLAIDRSTIDLRGALPEEVRQYEDVAEALSVIESQKDSGKQLVVDILELGQHCVQVLITTTAIVWNGCGTAIIPIALGGYLKYRYAHRISTREVASEKAAAAPDLSAGDITDVLERNAPLSIIQAAHSYVPVADRASEFRKAAAEIRLAAGIKNLTDRVVTNIMLEFPVAGACLYFLSQWFSGQVSSAWCIWLLISVWSLRDNINQVGSLVSSQVTAIKFAAMRHGFRDFTRARGDNREKIILTEAPEIKLLQARLRRHKLSRDTLNPTDLTIQAGHFVGVMGNNGVGKSSLVSLIIGRLLPTSGDVWIGGHNTRKKAVASGVLSQDFALVPNISVRENIELFKPNGRGMSAETVVDLLGIREAICENREHGLDTIVPGKSQRGTNFSGGQVQLIALARALATGSPLLVLDEPFSALALGLQKTILAALSRLEPKPTLIMVTHDAQQAVGLDSVMVLEGGRIVERGAPADLIKDPESRFYKLYTGRRGAVPPGSAKGVAPV
jgi:ABC-type multidrug transport system fused ATPase/permease subunit